jgi:hypothetical protein
MALTNIPASLQQYDPPILPKTWQSDGRKFYNRLVEVLKTSGVTIQPGQVDISTPNLNKNLLNPGGGGQSLISMTPSGMVFCDADGNTVFHFDAATGSLTISGTILTAAGLIGGFEITNSTLQNGDNIMLDSIGLIRIGSSTAPYFSVNDVQTYIGNAVVIKPGALQVTNLQPNLYYNNVTGVLYRTTWTGTLLCCWYGRHVLVAFRAQQAQRAGYYGRCADRERRAAYWRFRESSAG